MRGWGAWFRVLPLHTNRHYANILYALMPPLNMQICRDGGGVQDAATRDKYIDSMEIHYMC